MKTQDAISALRPLSNWSKSIAKLEEVLDHVLERESIIEKSEARLTSLTEKIEAADKKYSNQRQEHEAELGQYIQELAQKRLEAENVFEARRNEISRLLTVEETYLRDYKEKSQQTKDRLHDEEAILINSIRDKEAVLAGLAENLKIALANTSAFVNQMSREGVVHGNRVD